MNSSEVNIWIFIKKNLLSILLFYIKPQGQKNYLIIFILHYYKNKFMFDTYSFIFTHSYVLVYRWTFMPITLMHAHHRLLVFYSNASSIYSETVKYKPRVPAPSKVQCACVECIKVMWNIASSEPHRGKHVVCPLLTLCFTMAVTQLLYTSHSHDHSTVVQDHKMFLTEPQNQHHLRHL